jgi:hypothetical protein
MERKWVRLTGCERQKEKNNSLSSMQGARAPGSKNGFAG